MGFECGGSITREWARQMTVEELNHMIGILEEEVKEKRSGRRRELIMAVCDSINALVEEFPLVELYAGARCDECGASMEFDVLECLFSNRDKLEPDDFS